jgi:ferredoxin-NADP reductase
MNDRHPRSLNDDLVRTFTVSKIAGDGRQFSITVKKSGIVSSYLHSLKITAEPMQLTVKGVGGTFSCFENGRALPRMVWVAGGVGLTPFLAMHRALRTSGEPMPRIDVLFACRDDEIDLIREMKDLRVQVFDSTRTTASPADGSLEVHARRMGAGDLTPLVDDGATVFVCGPPSLTSHAAWWLDGTIEPGKLRTERFDF